MLKIFNYDVLETIIATRSIAYASAYLYYHSSYTRIEAVRIVMAAKADMTAAR